MDLSLVKCDILLLINSPNRRRKKHYRIVFRRTHFFLAHFRAASHLWCHFLLTNNVVDVNLPHLYSYIHFLFSYFHFKIRAMFKTLQQHDFFFGVVLLFLLLFLVQCIKTFFFFLCQVRFYSCQY